MARFNSYIDFLDLSAVIDFAVRMENYAIIRKEIC